MKDDSLTRRYVMNGMAVTIKNAATDMERHILNGTFDKVQARVSINNAKQALDDLRKYVEEQL